MKDDDALMVPVGRAAGMLGIGESTAYDLIARGEFPVTVRRVGKSYRIPRAELETFCAGQAAS